MKNFTLQFNLIILSSLTFGFCFSQSTATYDISLTTTWNASEHSSVPGSAHWSDLIGATHTTANEFMELGQIATLGIKDVAERGDNTEITSEINDAITAGKADQLLKDGFSPFAAISFAGFTDLNVNENFPLITLVSMVAPSPDWFIAVNSLNLRNDLNTDWKDTFTIDVFTYDAGTDDGTDYTSGNSANTPPVGITMMTGVPINGNKMATVTFTLKNVLSIDEESPLNSIKIYPNPVRDVLTIANIQNVDLKTIEIYNILGNLVIKVNIKDLSFNNNLQLNLSELNEGIYLTKIISKDDQSKTQKLIIH